MALRVKLVKEGKEPIEKVRDNGMLIRLIIWSPSGVKELWSWGARWKRTKGSAHPIVEL